MKMTIETLEQFRGMKSECDMITAEIESLYDTRKSPNGRPDAGHGSVPGNPTEHAVMDQIQPLQAILEAKHSEMMKQLSSVETWLESVSDAQIRALIRCYYILGKTWKATSIKIYGYPCPQRAHQKVHRFFGSDEKI